MRPIATDGVAWSVDRSVDRSVGPSVCLSVCLNRSKCRLVCGFGWPQGIMYWMGVQIAPWEGAIFRRKYMPKHARRHSAVSCAKWPNRSRCSLRCGLGCAQGSMCYMGYTLVQLGEYDWTVRVRRRRGLFVKLFWPLVIVITARRSYVSAVLGVVILSVRLSHACFVTNPKNLPAKCLHHMKGQSF